MPIQKCQVDGKPGWRWGKRGKCYHGIDGKKRAIRQALAITGGTLTDNRAVVVPSNPLKADPTRTATLRRVFQSALAVQYLKIRGNVLKLVVDEDVFGLRRDNAILGNVLGNNGAETTLNTRWRFLTDSQKVVAFQQWYAAESQSFVLDAATAQQAQDPPDLPSMYWLAISSSCSNVIFVRLMLYLHLVMALRVQSRIFHHTSHTALSPLN